MLISLLGFELKYHFRQVSFRIAALLFFVLGMLAVQGRFTYGVVYKNAPYVITYLTGIFSLLSVFTATLFAANVVLRDSHYRMEAVIFATAIERNTYFGARFLGLLLSVFLVLCFTLPGIFLGSLWAPSAQSGPYHLIHYLQPLLLFGLPNSIFCCSCLFCIALWFRSNRAVYTGGVLLYILYWVASIWGNSPLLASAALKTPEHHLLANLLDPFGLAPFLSETASWNDQQKNSRLFPLTMPLLYNRLLWIGITGTLLLALYYSFRFRILLTASFKQQKEPVQGPLLSYRPYPVQVGGSPYLWATFLSQWKLELRSLFRHIPFLVLLLLWIFAFAVELNDDLFNGPYHIHLYPATGIIAEKLLSIRPAALLLIFYAAELLHREKSARIEALVYSSPVYNGAMWAAKWCTLLALIVILITVNICIGITLQFSHGYFKPVLPVYGSLYYYSGMPMILYSVLILFIQTLVPNKYLGMLLNLLLTGLLFFSKKIGIEHYLLRFSITPGMSYSDMNGWGHYAGAFHWYMLYWSAFAALLACCSIRLWNNKRETHRINGLSRRPNSNAFKLLVAGCFMIWVSTGVYIYYQTNIAGQYKSSADTLDWQFRYEQKYRPLAILPQPIIQKVKTEVALYPKERKYDVKGSYLLKNESSEPIQKIWINTSPEVTLKSMVLSRQAISLPDMDFNQYWYTLEQALLPGDTMTLDFSLEVLRKGFSSFNNENSVVRNGSYIELEKYVPVFGYSDRYEIASPSIRTLKGLPKNDPTNIPDTTYHLIQYETIVSTEGDQQVFTPGILQRSWQTGGRNFFHYKTEQPINFMFALSSARYKVLKENYKGITLSIAYQPGQEANLKTMLQAMKDVLDYCQEHFGPYMLKQLSLAEIPQYRGTATAYPGVVFSAERNNFQGDFRDTQLVNHCYATVVHEVAHQWWANRLQPAYGPGAAMLTESLAKYTEAVVMEHRMGKMYLRQYLQADNHLYFVLRDAQEELPLYRSWDQPYVYYQKGGLAMYTLKEVLGEQRMNKALRNLLSAYAYPGRKALATDLIHELYKEAEGHNTQLIDDHLKKVIVYSLRLKVLSCQRLSNGQFKADLEVTISKTDQQNGSSKQVPINEILDIAFFNQEQGAWNKNTLPLYLQKHHFEKQTNRITVLLNKKPKVAAIDPYSYILDPSPENHIISIP